MCRRYILYSGAILYDESMMKHVNLISAGDQLREESQVKKIFNTYPLSISITEPGKQIISVLLSDY